MDELKAPYHAHIYYDDASRAQALALRTRLLEAKESGAMPELFFVGELGGHAVGPHPLPEYEIHYSQAMLAEVIALLEASGLRALVHPLTDDDVADHTTLAHWIGEPLPLKLETLDPPGVNQGVARFGKSAF